MSIERERLRQLCLNALEELSATWLGQGRVGLAIDAAFAAVEAESLRESAHRTLVEAHLAAGNCLEAARQYRHYRQLLREALGLEPSEPFRRLVSHLFAPATGAAQASR